MNTFDKVKAAWKARQFFNTIEKERKRMGDYEFKKTAAKAAKDFLITALAVASASAGAALGEYFSSRENIEAAIAVLPSPMIAVLVPLISAAAVALANWAKHRKGAAIVPLLILALASPAFAQDPAPAPPVELTLHGGAMQFAERGIADKRDFVYRLTLTVPAPSGLTLFARADYTRTQDGGDLLDPKTFRSIEGFVGGRKDIGSGFALTAFGGASWNRDSKIEPTDPRLYTAAAGVRFSVPGRGYVIAAAGHHGPVGGSAFLGSIVYEINSGASWFGDIAIPLDASRFAVRPYTIKAGISARLKGWKF